MVFEVYWRSPPMCSHVIEWTQVCNISSDMETFNSAQCNDGKKKNVHQSRLHVYCDGSSHCVEVIFHKE